MTEEIPRKEKNFEVSLNPDIFNQLEDLKGRIDSNLVSEYGDFLRLLKEGAFHYTNYFLENLLFQENLKSLAASTPDELKGGQEEVKRSDAARHYSDESLPINFRVIARFLSRIGISVEWFDAEHDKIRGLKEINMLKIFSVRYALESAFLYEKLTKKEERTSEEAKLLGGIISSLESVEELENIAKKFKSLSAGQRKDLIEKLNLEKLFKEQDL
jgi:hypothetical protein